MLTLFYFSQQLGFRSSITVGTNPSGIHTSDCSHSPFIVDAIIFMAPISGFDQVLVEDRSVNRLEDSVLIWKAVCSNKLLANVELVLFLNKCDILERKLASGVRLAKYVRSYGDRPNDLENASKCGYSPACLFLLVARFY
jgi:hypothetical protein